MNYLIGRNFDLNLNANLFNKVKYFALNIKKIKEIDQNLYNNNLLVQTQIPNQVSSIQSDFPQQLTKMSQNQQNMQKSTKSKEQIQKEKANTNAWHKKQQEKRKKKLEEQQQEQKPVELDEKALEKAKRKQQKRLEREQMLKEQQLAKQGEAAQNTKVQQIKLDEGKKPEKKVQIKKEQKKVQEKQPQAKQVEKQQKKQAKKAPQSQPKLQRPTSTDPLRKLSKDTVLTTAHKPSYAQLLTLQHHLQKSSPSSPSINKPAQSRLIHKYLDQYINSNDTVLILARSDSWKPQSDRCSKRVYLYPNHDDFVKNDECENITCTYEDVAYLMEGAITKIFVELDIVFANGVGMTEKGNQNIVCMANEFKIPVIGFSGTWNFNAWNFLSFNTFVNKYGEQMLEKYDIVENQQLEIIVLEIGSVIPKQISGHLENLSKIYRGCDFNAIKW